MLSRAEDELGAANGALAHLGEGRLSSISENRPAALYVRDHFANVRDALLRRHDWNFASRWETLSQDPTLPEGTFTKSYPLPADCIRVIELKGALEDDWSVEAVTVEVNGAMEDVNILSTDFIAPRIRFTRQVTSIGAWDALFLEIFELKLAAKIAPLLNRANGPDLDAQGEAKMPAGRKADSREKARSRVPATGSYLDVRRG